MCMGTPLAIAYFRLSEADSQTRFDPLTLSPGMGGDEFVVVCPELRNADDVQLVAERLEIAMERPFVIGGHSLSARASIGFTVGYGTRNVAEELLSRADAEMYRIKMNL